MKKLPALFIAALAFPLSFATSHAEECLKIASPPASFGAVALLAPGVKKSFKIAGICIDHVEAPSKRIQKQMMGGNIDGEFIRVMPYIKAMKDFVVHVPTAVADTKGVLVTLKSSGFTPKTLGDVGDKRIGIVHGVKWHEVIAPKLKKTKKGKKFANIAKQLKAGRLDGFLIDQGSLNRLFSSGGLKKSDTHVAVVADLSAYLVLHKKNASLVSKLDDAVKKVKNSGGFNIE